MSVMPPEIPRDVADLAKKEWTNPQTYFENMSTPIVSERISKESIALWESKEPKYFAQSMDRTIWMLVLNASHDSPRVETYQTTLYRILAERGSEAVTRSLRRHSDFVSKDVNVLKEYLERLGFMLKKNEKMMQPDIIREVAESKRDEMLKRIRSKRDSIRTMKRLLNMKVETESKNVRVCVCVVRITRNNNNQTHTGTKCKRSSKDTIQESFGRYYELKTRDKYSVECGIMHLSSSSCDAVEFGERRN